ncbi:aspartate/methionine/tyrosine aminotransferase [Arthrobacter sp. 2762]
MKPESKEPNQKGIELQSDIRRPFGHSAWAAPYQSVAPLVLGSSVVAPLELGELAAIADLAVTDLAPPGLLFEYGPPGGSLELREQIASAMPGLVADNVTVTAGAGDALAMVAELLCHPDAHVIIEIPTHESALVTAQRRGCAVSLLKAPVTPESVGEHVRSSTTAVFLSSPHNPTGQVLTAGMLMEIATKLSSVGALLVVDEVYRGLPLGVQEVPPAVAALVPNGVSIGSLSKVYGLPGLRLGWAAGPMMVVDDLRSIQRWTSRSPAVTSEAIGKVALDNSEGLLSRAKSLVYDSYVELAALCDRVPGIRLTVPDGGTTVFPEVDAPDVDAWCGSIAEEFGLLVAPGNACFGVPGRVRINLGLRPETRAQAFPLLAQALSKLHREAATSRLGGQG